jgi:hypothetical protein
MLTSSRARELVRLIAEHCNYEPEAIHALNELLRGIMAGQGAVRRHDVALHALRELFTFTEKFEEAVGKFLDPNEEEEVKLETNEDEKTKEESDESVSN